MNKQNGTMSPSETPASPSEPFDPGRARPLTDVAPIDPNYPHWGVGAGLLTWLGSVVLLLGAQILALVGYTLFTRSKIGETSETLGQNKTLIFLSVLSSIPAHLLTLGGVWAVVTRFGKRPFWRSLGWSWSENFGFWKSVGLAIGVYLVAFVVIYFIGTISTPFDHVISSSRAIAVTIAFLAIATAPIVEETVYRGVLFAALQKELGVNWAIIAVLALFTLVHVPQYWPDFGRIGALGLLSLVVTLVRAHTGRLLPCFIIHTTFNGVQAVLILIEPYLPKSIIGEEPKAPALLVGRFIRTLY